MFNQIAEFLSLPGRASGARKAESLQVAVAALLVQAAAMDDAFDVEERTAIEALLAAKFGLEPVAVSALMKQATLESANSLQLYPYIRAIMEQMDEGGRIGMIEMLWDVAYADGVLTPDEDALLRRIAGLIHVSDFDRGAARKRVLQRRGIGNAG